MSNEPMSEKVVMDALSHEELGPVVRRSSVTIGVNRVQTFRHSRRKVITYSRLRDIESPMMGACYLTEWTTDVPRLYEIGKEVETYKTAEELAEKIDSLSRDRERRCEMRRAGQIRALNEHSVSATFSKICRALDVNRSN